MAANVGNKFGQGENETSLRMEVDELKILQPSIPKAPEVRLNMVHNLKKELGALRASRRAGKFKLNKVAKELEKKMETNKKYLPAYVVSQRLQVAHRNSWALILCPSYIVANFVRLAVL